MGEQQRVVSLRKRKGERESEREPSIIINETYFNRAEYWVGQRGKRIGNCQSSSLGARSLLARLCFHHYISIHCLCLCMYITCCGVEYGNTASFIAGSHFSFIGWGCVCTINGRIFIILLNKFHPRIVRRLLCLHTPYYSYFLLMESDWTALHQNAGFHLFSHQFLFNLPDVNVSKFVSSTFFFGWLLKFLISYLPA